MDHNISKSAFRIPKVGEVWTYRTDKAIITKIIDPNGYNTQVEYVINNSTQRATIKEFNRWYNPPEIDVQQEQPKRIPKPGEVWRNGSLLLDVVNVYPDAVTYAYNAHNVSKLLAVTLDSFLHLFTPPEPTVVASRWLFQNYAGLEPIDCCTHRLDYMSDGEYRLVKL